MDQVEQRGKFKRVGHGVVSILLTELEQSSNSYGPNLPGTVASPARGPYKGANLQKLQGPERRLWWRRLGTFSKVLWSFPWPDFKS